MAEKLFKFADWLPIVYAIAGAWIGGALGYVWGQGIVAMLGFMLLGLCGFFVGAERCFKLKLDILRTLKT